jgi:hypothetical protein
LNSPLSLTSSFAYGLVPRHSGKRRDAQPNYDIGYVNSLERCHRPPTRKFAQHQ